MAAIVVAGGLQRLPGGGVGFSVRRRMMARHGRRLSQWLRLTVHWLDTLRQRRRRERRSEHDEQQKSSGPA